MLLSNCSLFFFFLSNGEMKKRALADVPKWLALSKTLEHYNSDVSNSCHKANLTGAKEKLNIKRRKLPPAS